MSEDKYRMIIEAKLPTAGMDKRERGKALTEFFKEAKKCMNHHADTNGRETFIILITASKPEGDE